jgi:predicted nucleotidyltransferase
MRITSQQSDAILASATRYFGAGTQVWLFGSRIDDQRRGGDIDLYIEPEKNDLLAELYCKAQLEEVLDLHVDLVVKRPGASRVIERIALDTGVRL